MKQIIVALVGFPNCGKTTLFNSLTGSCHPVGNWSGVTVDIKRHLACIEDLSFQCVDLPGCYTLLPSASSQITPLDQRTTQQYLESREASTILNVLDATDLEQQLAFTLVLLEQKLPVIVVLNMMDEALKQGKKIDIPALSHGLGCPVVPMVAIQKQGLSQLRAILI